MPGPSRTFAQALDDARRNIHREMEVQRVHNEAKKDSHHAYRNADIKGPDPWRDRTWRNM